MSTHQEKPDLESVVRSQQILFEKLLVRIGAMPPLAPVVSSTESTSGVEDFVAVTPVLAPGSTAAPQAFPALATGGIFRTQNSAAVDPVSEARQASRYVQKDALVEFFVSSLVLLVEDSHISPMQVDGEIFTISDRRFRRESERSRELLTRRTERPDGIIVIEDMKALDFERFVEAIHCE
jgi:hypothetical protein